MIDKVIIYDINIGNKYVSPMEIRQLMGRAGRTYNQFEQGQSYIFGKENEQEIIDNYINGNDNKITSNFNDLDKVSFHILPQIKQGNIKTKSDILNWYSKSLAYIQGNRIDQNEIFNYLIEKQCIDEQFNVLFNGEISIKYYYSPDRINLISEKLIFLNQIGDFSIMAFAWLCGYYQGNKINHPAYFDFKDNFTNKFYLEKNEEFDVFVYYLIFNNRFVKKIGSYIGKTKKDIHRLLQAIKSISQHLNIDIKYDLQLLENMLYYACDKKTAKIMAEIGIYDKKIIFDLANLSVYNKEDIQIKIDSIKEYANKKTYLACLDLIDKEKFNAKTS